MSGPGVTHHEHSCQHQAVPVITGLLLSRWAFLSYPLSPGAFTPAGRAPLRFLQSVQSHEVVIAVFLRQSEVLPGRTLDQRGTHTKKDKCTLPA